MAMYEMMVVPFFHLVRLQTHFQAAQKQSLSDGLCLDFFLVSLFHRLLLLVFIDPFLFPPCSTSEPMQKAGSQHPKQSRKLPLKSEGRHTVLMAVQQCE